MELKEIQMWEKYDAMLTIEERAYKVTMRKIYDCDNTAIKVILRKQLRLSKDIIKSLKTIVREFKKITAFRDIRKINKYTKTLERCLRDKVELDKAIQVILEPKMDEFNDLIENGGDAVEELGLVPVTHDLESDEFVEV